jgi:hypothetical protein
MRFLFASFGVQMTSMKKHGFQSFSVFIISDKILCTCTIKSENKNTSLENLLFSSERKIRLSELLS